MTTLTSPSRLIQLSAPLPSPRRFTLLDAAQLVTPTDNRWLGGAWIEGYPPGPAHTHDPCSSGTGRVKQEAGIIPLQIAGAFTAYLAGACTAASIGPDPQFWTDRLELAFQAVEAAAVERVLATGDGHATLGSFLADGNLEVLGAGAQDPVDGLALLEERLAPNGSGLIHAAPVTATHWASRGLIQEVRNGLYTKLGTPVAVGAGYIGAGSPGAGSEYAFATGPIAITRGEVILNPVNYSEALDRSNNDVVYLAERHYLLNWVARQDGSDPDHVQAGVLIDRTSATS